MPLLYFVAIACLVLDFLSKVWVRVNLPLGQRIEVWPGVMHLEHVQNFGAAWGMLSGHRWPLIVFSALIMYLAYRWAPEVARHGKWATTGLGMVLGGALGNMVDRVSQGRVTDFFDMDTSWAPLANFPVFNVADSCLTVGVIALVLAMALNATEAPESKNAELASRGKATE